MQIRAAKPATALSAASSPWLSVRNSS
jgi:hypothetical protein